MATFITEQDIYDGKRWVTDGSAISTFYGKTLITEVLNAVEEIDERTGNVGDRWKPSFNSAKFDNAHAFWIDEEVASGLAIEGIGAFPAPATTWALFSIPLDAHDIYAHALLKEQKAYLVESYPGGIGIAKKVLERWRSVLEVGIRVAEGCRCRKGCPNCIVPPRSRIDVDKTAGIRLARQVIREDLRPCRLRVPWRGSGNLETEPLLIAPDSCHPCLGLPEATQFAHMEQQTALPTRRTRE